MTREFFTHMKTSPLPVKAANFKILTYALHSWPLSSEGCHNYCDTGHPFIMVISEDPLHSHLLPSVKQEDCPYLFLQLWSFAAGIRTPNLLLAGPTLWPTRPPLILSVQCSSQCKFSDTKWQLTSFLYLHAWFTFVRLKKNRFYLALNPFSNVKKIRYIYLTHMCPYLECYWGTYGYNCDEKCQRICSTGNGTCDALTGSCPAVWQY